MENYKNWLKANGKSVHTIAAYVGTARAFKEWFLHKKQLETFIPSQVTANDLQEWKSYLMATTFKRRIVEKDPPQSEKKYALSSVHTYIKQLKSYFDFLMDTGVINNNAATQLKPPKKDKANLKDHRGLQKQERKILLRYMQDTKLQTKNRWRFARNKAIIFTLLYAGLKRNELTSLTLSDLSFENMNSAIFVAEGNGGNKRFIPMHPDLKLALLEWLEQRGNQEHDYVFISQERNPISAQMIWYLCENIGKKLGIQNCTPHSFRYTFARDLVSHRYRLKEIAYLLGNSSLNFTRQYLRSNEFTEDN